MTILLRAFSIFLLFAFMAKVFTARNMPKKSKDISTGVLQYYMKYLYVVVVVRELRVEARVSTFSCALLHTVLPIFKQGDRSFDLKWM